MVDGGASGPPGPDLGSPRRIHLVGIGGTGMSAIAEVLAGQGHRVSGSDAAASPVLDRLRRLGVDARAGHDAGHVAGAEVVAVSTAIGPDNPEVEAARRAGIPVLRRAGLLAAIAATRRTVAVSGTHGKTTTSAMLALVLGAGGMRPSFVVGGVIRGRGSGAAWDTGEWLVLEADESDGTFLELPHEVAVVTSVEADHLDHHGSLEQLVSAFGRFLATSTGPRLVCADDPTAARLGAEAGAASYGVAADADFRVCDLELGPAGTRFRLQHDGRLLGAVSVPVPGRHNALNGSGAAAVALMLGLPFGAVAAALAAYPGVARRFEPRGEAGGVTFVDDYAHLPTEVEAAVAAARTGGWRRVVCVFQPHRYSRTGALAADFADAFEGCDLLVVTDVYPAGEAPVPGVTGKLVVNAVLDADPTRPVAYLPRRDGVVAYLRSRLRPGDLCLTLGAGDLTSLPDELLAERLPAERLPAERLPAERLPAERLPAERLPAERLPADPPGAGRRAGGP